MRNTGSFLLALAAVGCLAAGCAGPEKKLGRGLRNFGEIARLGEMRRSIEQAALFESPDIGYTTGFVRGFNRSAARVSLGLYEILTFPIPSYDPIWTTYLKPEPPYPDNYTPDLLEDPMFDTDSALGFSSGDVMPFFPNSRFRIFEH